MWAGCEIGYIGLKAKREFESRGELQSTNNSRRIQGELKNVNC